MIILDRMLVGGLRFVLDKIATAVEAELNDSERLREELLAAQMRLELGEITEDEFAGTERAILARLREIREREREGPSPGDPGYRVAGVEASADVGDEAEGSGVESDASPPAKGTRVKRARKKPAARRARKP